MRISGGCGVVGNGAAAAAGIGPLSLSLVVRLGREVGDSIVEDEYVVCDGEGVAPAKLAERPHFWIGIDVGVTIPSVGIVVEPVFQRRV